MTSEEIERLETKIAFLESANVELSDVVYRQQQEIAALRARLDALAQRIDAAQTTYTPRTPYGASQSTNSSVAMSRARKR